jgi:hypothetical protein
VWLTLPQGFIQPLGLLLAFTGDQHPLASAPSFGGNGTGHSLVCTERTSGFCVFKKVERCLFHDSIHRGQKM